MKERRQHERYHVSYPAESGSGNLNIILELKDVSEGGAAFTAVQQLSKSDMMAVRIFMKHKMFSLKAEVVYSESAGEEAYNTGARFIAAPKEFSQELEKEMEEISQLQKKTRARAHKNISFEEAAAEYLQPEE